MTSHFLSIFMEVGNIKTEFHSSVTNQAYLHLQVRLGKNGVEEVLGLGSLSDYEKEGLEKLKPELLSSIEKGIKFANQ